MNSSNIALMGMYSSTSGASDPDTDHIKTHNQQQQRSLAVRMGRKQPTKKTPHLYGSLNHALVATQFLTMWRCLKRPWCVVSARLLRVTVPGLIVVACMVWAWLQANTHGHCEMSYMAPYYTELKFSKPTPSQSVAESPIPFVSKYHDRYKLYRYTDAFGTKPNSLGGYPCIFLPGNRGR